MLVTVNHDPQSAVHRLRQLFSIFRTVIDLSTYDAFMLPVPRIARAHVILNLLVAPGNPLCLTLVRCMPASMIARIPVPLKC